MDGIKVKVGELKGKPIVEGDANLISNNEILYKNNALLVRDTNGNMKGVTKNATTKILITEATFIDTENFNNGPVNSPKQEIKYIKDVQDCTIADFVKIYNLKHSYAIVCNGVRNEGNFFSIYLTRSISYDPYGEYNSYNSTPDNSCFSASPSSQTRVLAFNNLIFGEQKKVSYKEGVGKAFAGGLEAMLKSKVFSGKDFGDKFAGLGYANVPLLNVPVYNSPIWEYYMGNKSTEVSVADGFMIITGPNNVFTRDDDDYVAIINKSGTSINVMQSILKFQYYSAGSSLSVDATIPKTTGCYILYVAPLFDMAFQLRFDKEYNSIKNPKLIAYAKVDMSKFREDLNLPSTYKNKYKIGDIIKLTPTEY